MGEGTDQQWGDTEQEVSLSVNDTGTLNPDGGGGFMSFGDADIDSYMKEVMALGDKLDDMEKNPEAGWTLSLDAAAEALKCDAKQLAWLAVTWENPGEMGLKIVPRDEVGDAKTGAQVSAVRPRMPKQLKAGLIFVALNGELVMNLDYSLIMKRLQSGVWPLTVQFITHSDGTAPPLFVQRQRQAGLQ